MEEDAIATGDLPIVQYWHSEEIPADVAALIATFDELNPARPHVVFDRDRAERFVAERFSTAELDAFRACAIPAMQSDYLRYCAAHALGGVCVDADTRCVAPLDAMLEGGGGRLFRHVGEGGVMNGLFAFGRPRHPLPRLALDLATANIAARRSEHVWATTGPLVPNALLRFHEGGSFEATLAETHGPRIKRLYEGFRDAIGAYERVTEAFEDVRIGLYEEAAAWILEPEVSPAYKAETNWAKPDGSIYTDAGPAPAP